MQDEFRIDAVSRGDQGKGASRRLRHAGMVPGIIYGGDKDPQMIATRQNELGLHLEQEAFYSHILSVVVDGKAQKVVMKDMQRHPSKPYILHFDLLRVSMDEAIRMTIPIHFEGEEESPGIKAGGTLLRGMSDLDIECLPSDLPEYVSVDVSAMEIDDVLHLSQLVLPKGVALVGADRLDEDNDPMMVTIEVVRAAVEPEEEEAAEVVEGEVKPADEGESSTED